jgi:acyl-CoA reductase-like NAD-dependent aldehyde dehydrogenase
MSRRLEVRRRSSGPVVPVTKFKTLDEAVAIGNDTVYGLAGVWSRNIDNCYRVGRAIKAGRLLDELLSVYPAGAAFGGYKKSGFGREPTSKCSIATSGPRTCWYQGYGLL